MQGRKETMEDELIGQAQSGDHQAFRQLVDNYTPLLWRVAYTMLGERMAAEDALQEAWLDVWGSLPRFQHGRPLRPWLLTILANRCRMAMRKRRLPQLSLDEESEPAAAVDPAIAIADSNEYLLQILSGLPPEQKRVLELRFFADLELAEIAQVTSWPLGTVKSRLHRALAVLRETIKDSSVTAQEE